MFCLVGSAGSLLRGSMEPALEGPRLAVQAGVDEPVGSGLARMGDRRARLRLLGVQGVLSEQDPTGQVVVRGVTGPLGDDGAGDSQRLVTVPKLDEPFTGQLGQPRPTPGYPDSYASRWVSSTGRAGRSDRPTVMPGSPAAVRSSKRTSSARSTCASIGLWLTKTAPSSRTAAR